MDFLTIAIAQNTVLAGALLLVLGLWTWFERRDKPVHQTFAALLIAASLLLFSLVLWAGASDVRQGAFWTRSIFLIGSFLPALYLLFTLAYIGRFPSQKWQVAIIAPCFLLYVVAFLTPLLVTTTVDAYAVAVPGKALFAWQFALTLSAALFATLREIRHDPAFDRNKIAPLVLGGISMFLAIFMLLFGVKGGATGVGQPWFQSVAIAVMIFGLLAMAYMVDKRKFQYDVKPVGTELFILVVIFLVSMDIATAKTSLDLSVRLVILVVLVIYGATSVRVAAREVQRLRQIGVLNEQLVKVNGRLIEAGKLKTKLVSFATHQMRAPIGGIRGYLELLREGSLGPVTAKQKETLTITADAVTRLSDTVDSFLGAAKLETGMEEILLADTDVAKLAAQVADVLRPLAERKGIELAVSSPMGLPQVPCDAGKLYHVIANLVHNAIKFTDEGGVTVSVAVAEGLLLVRVADSGIGLAPQKLASLRDVLGGVSPRVTFEANGSSGLGLYIASGIVRAHGGSISVESSGLGQGTTFTMRIPVAAR
ncbi:MAG: hypothetical protein RLZZ324_742 [Candidatus Parcubacteria bacterium]|jgi:signal transduction histidine kinase